MIPGITAGSAGPWTPARLSPKLWLDDSTAVSDVSGFAAQWNDQSANAWHFSQSSAGSRPAIDATGLNGLRVLVFDGSSDGLVSDAARAIYRNTTAAWVFVVMKKVASQSGDANVFSVTTNADNKNRFGFTAGNSGPNANLRSLIATRDDGDGESIMREPSAADLDWHLNYAEANYAARTAQIIVDAVQTVSAASFTSAGSATSNTLSYSPVGIGCFPYGGGVVANANVAIAAVIAGSAIPSAGDLRKLEGWAAWRYGLEGNLPSGHPYKDAPP